MKQMDVALDPLAGTVQKAGPCLLCMGPGGEEPGSACPICRARSGAETTTDASPCRADAGSRLSPPVGADEPVSRLNHILAIDPGTTESGWCILVGSQVRDSGVMPNDDMLAFVSGQGGYATLAIEMIASYGMPVGREVFETCVWIGRFMQAWGHDESVQLVYRKDVKMHLCGTTKAKDGNVRQAIIDLYPPSGGGATPQIGIKAKPGPLYGVSSHAWPALGVALTVQATTR